jgi:hypothetical protein
MSEVGSEEASDIPVHFEVRGGDALMSLVNRGKGQLWIDRLVEIERVGLW